MGFFTDDPYDGAFLIADPAKDKKTGLRLEQFRFGQEAVYFPPQKYLPYSACTGVENVSRWPVKIGGDPTSRFKASVTATGVKVFRVGTMVVFR